MTVRFGINFFSTVTPEQKSGARYFDEALRLSVLADELGYRHVRTVEHYFRPVGILQAGFFYKTLSDPIYSTRNRFSGSASNCAQFPICDVLLSINGPSGHITGFEASWEQRLSFLPGLLNGFGVAANYSYTTSRVTFPTGFNAPASDPTLGRSDHPHLQRQAPNNSTSALPTTKLAWQCALL